MQTETTVQCPFCGQLSTLELDTTLRSQRFVTDCETCCRPMEVHAECENGEIVSIDSR